MAPRGRPKETVAQRNIRRHQSDARRRERQRIAQLLRDIAARGINDGRRYSLRLASQYLNRDHPGRYTFVLFGEEGWKENDLFDHNIRLIIIIPSIGDNSAVIGTNQGIFCNGKTRQRTA